ncbi:MAG TPA: methyltransferase domain-containing protein [Acidimicrobiales bacterium]|nr:methyltransferase domain-containing protein [Acidimicrobiales bacterium]
MHEETVAIYEHRGLQWAESHARAGRKDDAETFASHVSDGVLRLDIGCGAGRYAPHLGQPLIGLDASKVMLAECRRQAPDGWYVLGDVEALPFANRSLGGGWSCMTHLHVPRARLPMALWDLQRVLAVGAPFDIQVLSGDYEGNDLPGDDTGGRFFAGWQPEPLTDVVTGAGFDVEPASVTVSGDELRLRARRARTLGDTVGPGMRLLVCGLNPSVYSADAGVPFARPGNRFWPAALGAGLVHNDRDPAGALASSGIGLTDLAKRATRTAAELDVDEYREGLARVDRLVRWLQPGAVCFVGLAGWRAVVDRTARPGVQPQPLGDRPVYLMPSTSGLNGRSSLGDLTDHLRRAASLADEA